MSASSDPSMRNLPELTGRPNEAPLFTMTFRPGGHRRLVPTNPVGEKAAAALQRAAIAFFELDQQRLAVSRPGAFLGGLVISPCLLLGKSCRQFTSTYSRSAKIFRDNYAVLFPVLPNVI